MKSELHIIVAIADNGAIGMKGDMPWGRQLPADLRHFKETTMGYPIVMGRKTFESLPKGALPGRQNIVVTRNTTYHAEGAEVVHSLEEAMEVAKGEKLFLIGGGELYRQGMALADQLHVTLVHHQWPEADTFFPDIDIDLWECTQNEPHEADERNAFPLLLYHLEAKSIMAAFEVLYEDNHLIIVSKRAGEITQGDSTGDVPLPEKVKLYLKEKYQKPGNVFLGVVHRLDRPVSGVVVFAKTSKALSRMNRLFHDDKVEKVYHAIVEQPPKAPEGTLVHWLKKNPKQNKSYIVASGTKGAKKARLHYRVIGESDRYTLLEVRLETGRHHQIRSQLSGIGCTIRGDLKYGAKRSNPDGSISLHAREVSFTHPVSGEAISVVAPYPSEDPLWSYFK